MPLQLAAFDKARQSELVEGVRVVVSKPFPLAAPVGQRIRQYEVTEPDRGKEYFAEGPDIDDSLAVELVQRTYRMSGVHEFAVVVVFDDVGVSLLRVLDQRNSSLYGKRTP
jgi:hypothetical protein